MIVLNNVSKYALDSIQLEIYQGETLALIGASGSGKTTLLKLLNRLLEPDAGDILLHGKNIQQIPGARLRRQIGYVIQHIGLFPHLTILENMLIVLNILKIPQKKQLERAHELFALIQLDFAEFAARYPHELSGGQQQRIGVARALAFKPEILLMDEPFGALDAITRDNLQQELLRIKKNMPITIVLVTHDIQEAMRLGDRIAVLNEGKILQIDTPENIQQAPASDYIAKLLGNLGN